MGKRKKVSRQDWQTYKRLLAFAKPYRRRLALGVLFGAVFGGSIFGLLFGIEKFFGILGDAENVGWNSFLAAVFILPIVAVVYGVGSFASKYLVEWVGNRVVMDLRNNTFAHIHKLSLNYFSSSRAGELISRTTNDSLLVQRAVSTVLGDAIKQPFALIAAIVGMFWCDVRLTLLSLIFFPVCILPVQLFGRRVRKASRESLEHMADLVSILQETIGGVRVVKAFNMAPRENERFQVASHRVFNRLMRISRSRAAVEPIIVMISVLGLVPVACYAKWSGMPLEKLITFAAAMILMYDPAKKLSRIHLSVQESSGAADRIFEVLDTPILVKNRPDAKVFSEQINEVLFENIAFSYGADDLFSGVNLKVKAGECLALVGSSGSGKTTLVSLVPRFFDVTAGAVKINGKDIRDMTMESLRDHIGIVTQDSILFNETIANNIAYGCPDATQEEIEAAAKKANAHKFILEQPQGYKTMCGDRGARLSGGQAQRISIARAMLKNPSILILDEATSALDTESERLVQAALDELMADRTVFAIAHRLSTIAHADRIVVMDKGTVAEQGTHKELLAQDGLYKHFHDLQFNYDKQET